MWLGTLQWRDNERDGISNHRCIDCLPNRLFRHKSKKTPKLRITGPCEGNSLVTSEFPAQRTSNAENVFIWCRRHDPMDIYIYIYIYMVGWANNLLKSAQYRCRAIYPWQVTARIYIYIYLEYNPERLFWMFFFFKTILCDCHIVPVPVTTSHGRILSLPWRHNECNSVSKHRRLDLFTWPFVQTQIKENIKTPRHWPWWGEFPADRWIPRTKGQ